MFGFVDVNTTLCVTTQKNSNKLTSTKREILRNGNFLRKTSHVARNKLHRLVRATCFPHQYLRFSVKNNCLSCACYTHNFFTPVCSLKG